MKKAAVAIAFVFVCIYLFCVNYADTTDAAIARNRLTGDVTLQQSGWHITAPWVSVAVIDTRPMRVCVPSGGRNTGCKLIQFQSTAYQEFVKTEGFRYWWWSNRISFNMGYDDEYRGGKDILRGYAFSGSTYAFLSIQKEYGK